MDFDRSTQSQSPSPPDSQSADDDLTGTSPSYTLNPNENPAPAVSTGDESEAKDDTAPSIANLEIATRNSDNQINRKLNPILPVIAACCITSLVVGLALFLVYLQKSQLPVKTTPSSQAGRTTTP